MSEKSGIAKGIIFYLISIVLLVLTFGNPILFFLLVPAAAAFAYAASSYISFNPAVVLLVGGALSYIITADMWYTVLLIVFSCILVIVFKLACAKNFSLTTTVGWGTLISSVFIAGIFLLMVYLANGKPDLSFITDPIRQFGNQFIADTQESFKALAGMYGTGDEELSEMLNMLSSEYRVIIDNIIKSLPGLFIALVMICTYLSNLLSRLLSRKAKRPLRSEGLFGIRLPGLIGISFVIGYILLLFVDGRFASIVMNYLIIFELPLLCEGIGTVYGVITMKWTKAWVKALVIIGTIFTLFNLLFNMSWLFLCIGAMDTYTDFRGRLKKRMNKNQEDK